MHPEDYGARRALVVDDDPSIVAFVSDMLKSAGWEVVTAATGDEALSAARRYRPAAVFLDVTIPKQSGWLVCAKLKLVKAAPAIILMTGLSGERIAQYATLVGADGMLRKPLRAQDILRTLGRVTSANR